MGIVHPCMGTGGPSGASDAGAALSSLTWAVMLCGVCGSVPCHSHPATLLTICLSHWTHWGPSLLAWWTVLDSVQSAWGGGSCCSLTQVASPPRPATSQLQPICPPPHGTALLARVQVLVLAKPWWGAQAPSR